MKLLAIDTSTLVASVALLDHTGVLIERERQVRTHSDVLLALVDETLTAAATSVGELEGVAVGAGPGSFTGLRIGLATAKGLCFARDLPLWTVSSLAALALDAGPGPELVAAIIDAKKDEVFVGCFRVEHAALPPVAVGDERVLAPDDVAAYLARVGHGASVRLLGTGVSAYPEAVARAGRAIAGARATPTAAAVGALALAGARQADLAAAAPTYVRVSDAELDWRAKPA